MNIISGDRNVVLGVGEGVGRLPYEKHVEMCSYPTHLTIMRINLRLCLRHVARGEKALGDGLKGYLLEQIKESPPKGCLYIVFGS